MELDHYLQAGSLYACINQQAWMFLSRFEKLRKKICETQSMVNMLHLGPRTFEGIGGEVVQTTAFMLRNKRPNKSCGTYIRLVSEKTAKQKREKALYAIQNSTVTYRYDAYQAGFSRIPGNPIAYWANARIQSLFTQYQPLHQVAEPRLGMATANNKKFVRYWYEVSFPTIAFYVKNRAEAVKSRCRWFPYNKGGEFRKWYGNNEFVIDWENDGERIRQFTDKSGKVRSHNYNLDYIFKPSLTWSALSSGTFSCRYFPGGYLFDNVGSSIFCKDADMLYYIQGFLSTTIPNLIFLLNNPTLNYQPGTVGAIPLNITKDQTKKRRIIQLVKRNIQLAKIDWDTAETS